jgi:hypothetical protein
MSESSPSPSNIPIDEGHVRLVLLQNEHSSFFLDIPLDIIESVCLKPRKYLLFLGWCILGVEGVLATERNGVAVDTNSDDATLEESELYYYNTEDEGTFSSTIPLLLCAQNTYDEHSV